MRKLLLLALLLIFPAVSFGADAASVTLHVNGTDAIVSPDVVKEYTPAVMSGDEELEPEELGEVNFPALSGTNYTFATIQNALEFASDPQKYIEANYRGNYYNNPSYDITYDDTLKAKPISTAVAVSIEISNIDSTVKFSDYPSLTDLTFTATRTLTATSRHFAADNLAATAVFSNIIFSGGGNGGGVEITDGTVTLTRCTFSRCEASSSGGGLSVSGGNITLTSPRFSDCYASTRGGAVSVTGGTVTITGATFSNCEAADYGGAVSVTGGSVTVSGSSTFTGNRANDGGAVSITGGNMSVMYVTFYGNEANNGGGAIYASSSLEIGTGVRFNDVEVSSPNVAENGGAIFIGSGTVRLSGSSVNIVENRANSNGGAIYIATGTLNLEGNGSSFTGNTVSNDGGAIWAGSGSTVNVTGNNIALTTNRTLSGNGGAFYIDGRGTVSIRGISPDISSNYAEEGNGGAFYMAGGSTLNLATAMRLSDNIANSGGCIYMANARNTTNLNITGDDDVVFSHNDAIMHGGAIYAEANCNILIEPEISFTGNSARNGNGGAIWVADALQLPEGTVYFASNTAGLVLPVTPSPAVEWPANGNGGAIYAASSSNAVIGTTRDYQFTATNTARYHGGALTNYSGDIVIQGYVLSRSITVRNSAGLGGGLAASCVGSVSVNNCSIMNQSATNGNGGAIWA